MPWLEAAFPARMTRIALVAPADGVRAMLVAVGVAGVVEIDAGPADADQPDTGTQPGAVPGSGPATGAGLAPDGSEPVVAAGPPDLAALRQAGRLDLIAGEDQVSRYSAAAVRADSVAALAGWVPTDRLPALARALAGIGCAAAPLPRPPGRQAPTLVTGSGQRALSPLVATYGTVPYADVNPAWLAWASYVLMFGMMFGDVGDGLLLIAAAAALRFGWPRWTRKFRAAWPFVAGAGLAAAAFGFGYGEFFGPTGVVPTLWLNPLDEPVQLLLAGLGIGVVLLAAAYGLGMLNRWREGGWPLALYAPSGLAGSVLFLGIGVLAAGVYFSTRWAVAAGVALAVLALAGAFAGFWAESGGGGLGVTQATVEVFDLVIRLASNIVSFARLAAFGLAHAALGLLVWDGTTSLWHRGGGGIAAAIVLFIAGSALAFALEALVAAVQALRLEYYELFSRIFVGQGRPFRPWRLRVETGVGEFVAAEEETVRSGAAASGRAGPGEGKA
jgi:V/A-type H+-transporting ATPase subunit I